MFENDLIERRSRIDKLSVWAVLGLLVLGVAFVYSATMARQSGATPLYNQVWFRQIVWYGVGLAAAITLCFVDYHILARWWLIAYWGSVITLVAVLIPHIGTTHGRSAMRWIDLG